MSNSLDPGQARHFVGPDLGLNCLRRLSGDNTSKQRAKVGVGFVKENLGNLKIYLCMPTSLFNQFNPYFMGHWQTAQTQIRYSASSDQILHCFLTECTFET